MDNPESVSLTAEHGYQFLQFNWNTIVFTWVCIGILVLLAFLVQALVRNKGTAGHYVVVSTMQLFVNMLTQSMPTFASGHLYFIVSLFIFIALCNTLSVIPWMSEPTADPNTTLALGITSFAYTQFYQIRAGGLWTYIKGYFSPIFVMLPINIIGKLASVISLSFRLFGNIFGGFLITDLYFQAIEGSIMWELAGILSGMNIIMKVFFGVFEGFLQAFVFTMLTLTYLSLALQGEGH